MTDEKKFEVHAEITVRLTKQDVDDIMVSALEGGICYWSDCAEVVGCCLSEYASGQISRGGKLKIHVDEPFDEANTEWYELDMEKFAQASASGWRTAAIATALSAMAKLTPARSTAKWQTSSSSTPCLAK